METALAILMVLGIFVGVPALIGLIVVGVVIWSDRLPRRVKRAKAKEAAAEGLGDELAETRGERAQSQLTKIPADSTIKPHSEGVIEFETNASTRLLYDGVIASGPASSLKGMWTLVSSDAYPGKLVVDENFIHGLLQAAKDLGIAPGDRIRINFNTWTREAKITKVTKVASTVT